MTFPATNPLHLYRALLRETTYLFDRYTRRWTYDYVRSSFRAHAPKARYGKKWKTIPYDPHRIPPLSERRLLKRGRKFQALLYRANQGHQRPLRNVLQLAYGRKGRRKRALMAPLMQPGLQFTPAPSDKNKVFRDTLDGKSVAPLIQWQAPASFMSLLHTQNQLSEYLGVRRQIRFNPPEIKTNRWGRAMPASRVKNKTRKWYARMASALMPPVPEDEWNHLRAVAMRKQELQPPPRRVRAKLNTENKGIEDAQGVAHTIVSGITKIPGQRRAAESVRSPHKITARFLSRIYAKHVFNHTPFADHGPENKTLVSKWDDGKREGFLAAKPNNDRHVETLFG